MCPPSCSIHVSRSTMPTPAPPAPPTPAPPTPAPPTPAPPTPAPPGKLVCPDGYEQAPTSYVTKAPLQPCSASGNSSKVCSVCPDPPTVMLGGAGQRPQVLESTNCLRADMPVCTPIGCDICDYPSDTYAESGKLCCNSHWENTFCYHENNAAHRRQRQLHRCGR